MADHIHPDSLDRRMPNLFMQNARSPFLEVTKQ